VRALLPVLVTLLVGVAAVPSAQAKTCHDAVSSYTKLRGISCAQAKVVVKSANAALNDDRKPPFMPECKGNPSAKWNGWKFTAVGTLGIDIVATKGSKSFHFGGGGACS
jgi:hypothetical protein